MECGGNGVRSWRCLGWLVSKRDAIIHNLCCSYGSAVLVLCRVLGIAGRLLQSRVVVQQGQENLIDTPMYILARDIGVCYKET